MSELRFQIIVTTDSSPREWVRLWAERYRGDDDAEHRCLIDSHQSLSADDFERIGKWKEGITTEAAIKGRWKPNVASVAYLIWMQAAKELPKPPKQHEVAAFLDRWSTATYSDCFSSGKTKVKRFGLSRATTLLHFVSGGEYPIFDQRVRTAVARLRNSPVQNTVPYYLNSFCPLFRELAMLCGLQDDLRSLDKALFSYGAFPWQ
jgi:hypothetical protein